MCYILNRRHFKGGLWDLPCTNKPLCVCADADSFVGAHLDVDTADFHAADEYVDSMNNGRITGITVRDNASWFEST